MSSSGYQPLREAPQVDEPGKKSKEIKLEVRKPSSSQEDIEEMQQLLTRINTSSKVWISLKKAWNDLHGIQKFFAGAGITVTAVAPATLFNLAKQYMNKHRDDQVQLDQCKLSYNVTEPACAHHAENTTDPCNNLFSTWCASFDGYAVAQGFGWLSSIAGGAADLYSLYAFSNAWKDGTFLTIQDFSPRPAETAVLAKLDIDPHSFISTGIKQLESYLETRWIAQMLPVVLWGIVENYLKPWDEKTQQASSDLAQEQAKTELFYIEKFTPEDIRRSTEKDEEEAKSHMTSFRELNALVSEKKEVEEVDLHFLHRSAEYLSRFAVLAAKQDIYHKKIHLEPTSGVSSSRLRENEDETKRIVLASKDFYAVSRTKNQILGFAKEANHKFNKNYTHFRTAANKLGKVHENVGALQVINVMKK